MALILHTAVALSLSPLFTDHVVLQRDKPVPVWGTATPGQTVAVQFLDQKKDAVADDSGNWRVVLDPLKASAEPATLHVTGEGGKLEVKDVLVGEVWVCSGQSNMHHLLRASLNAKEEIAEAHHPLIRFFEVPTLSSRVPMNSLTGSWVVCDPAIGDTIRAVPYFFGRDLQKELGVPVGLIVSAWGGTSIEAWMSEPALADTPFHKAVTDKWTAVADRYAAQLALYNAEMANRKSQENPGPEPTPPGEKKDRDGRSTLFGLYNAMIHPLLPNAIRGIIWYQGEGNANASKEYRSLFPALIKHWRQAFGQGDLPFYFVQLPNYAGHSSWIYQRESQAAALDLANTGMAVTIDIGEPRELHPPNKQDVGRRLALIALANTYGRNVVFSGPVFKEATPDGGAIRVSFKNDVEFIVKDAAPNGFELAGADKDFHPADIKIEGKTLVASSPLVPSPMAIRYAWSDVPPVTLYTTTGIPAAPFRSDNWSGGRIKLSTDTATPAEAPPR